jgi:hypothetical protein
MRVHQLIRALQDFPSKYEVQVVAPNMKTFDIQDGLTESLFVDAVLIGAIEQRSIKPTGAG